MDSFEASTAPASPPPRAPHDTASTRRTPWPPWLLATLACTVAALVLVPGLWDYGLWSRVELPALDRARAALGEPLSDLERSPWLPDALRAWALGWTGQSAAIRMPGALCASATVGLTVWIARVRGASPLYALLAGAFVLAFPGVLHQGRLVVGNAAGEMLSTLAVALAVGACSAERGRAARGLFAAAALVVLAVGASASGVILGTLVPLVAIALLAGATRTPRWTRLLLWLAAAVIAVVAARLISHQGEGYIPVLAAAKDLEILGRPETRPFSAALEDLGYQLFPWLPLVAIGALRPGRDPWPTQWWVSAVLLTMAWTLWYGRIALPLAVPSALCAASAVAHLANPRTSTRERRMLLLTALVGLLVMAKDSRRTPSRIGMPITERRGEHNYPAQEVRADTTLPRYANLAALGLLLMAIGGPRSRSASGTSADASGGRLARALERTRASLAALVPSPVRAVVPPTIGLLLLGHQALGYGRGLLPDTSLHESPMRALTRHAAWADAGALPRELGVAQLRDPGVALYGPGAGLRADLKGRNEFSAWLSSQEPAALLVRATDVAYLFGQHRRDGWPMFVLDASNRDLMLVSNVLPPGARDENPLLEVVFDAPPTLDHETLLRFDDVLEVVAWQLRGPLRRGGEATVELVLRPLKKIPGTTRIYTRLQKGKLSRANVFPQQLTDGRYAPVNWRPGDYIVHRQTFEIPSLEIVPGEHDLVIGLRRTEQQNYAITIPADKRGDFDVQIRDKRRNFAKVGTVEIY